MIIQHAPRISVIRDPLGAERQLPDGHVRLVNFMLAFDRADRCALSFNSMFRVTTEELNAINSPWDEEEANAIFLEEINHFRIRNGHLGRDATLRESMVELFNRRRNASLTMASAPALKILSASIAK